MKIIMNLVSFLDPVTQPAAKGSPDHASFTAVALNDR